MIPFSDILVRSLSGYVWMLPLLLLYFLFLKKAGKKQSLLHIAGVFLFCYYLFGVLTVTGIGYTSKIRFRPALSLIPFVGMVTGPIDTALNAVLFVPLGFFLPLLYEKYRRITPVAATGFLLSLSVELAQMFDWGSSDINDLIVNTAGACLGYLLYRLLSKVMPVSWGKQLCADKVNGPTEVLLFASLTFFLMIFVQPWVVHSLLHIG